MAQKRSARVSVSNIPKAIGFSLIVSMLITVLGIAVGAYLVHKEMIMQENMGLVVTTVLTLSSAAGALTAILAVKRMKLQMSFLSGASYFLLLLSMTALFFEGQYNGVAAAGIAILTGCSIVAILNILPGRRGKLFKTKTAYR